MTTPERTSAPVRAGLTLLMIVAGAVYAAGIPLGLMHNYYGPAVYTMSQDWTAFLWGAFDTGQSITMDKLPLAFQVQALSARVFGYSTWSVLMPQVLAAVATIGLTFATVRCWAGERAGLLAATAYALTPIVAALAHSQIVDTLLTFLLACAAYAWTRALESDRLGWLLASGAAVGLAFNVKMAQAWGVLPALAIGYLVAAQGGVVRRLARLGVAGVVTLVVSLWWVALAAVVPASSRPWIDGSSTNSAWDMVFGYNLTGRYAAESAGGAGPPGSPGGTGGPGYLLGADVATQVGWLYPLALTGLVALLLARRGRPRTDLARASALMWAIWLVTFALAFSLGRVAHSFYVVALAPGLVSLAAAGSAQAWRDWRAGHGRGWLLPLGLAGTVGWTVWLLSAYPDFLPWLRPAVAVLGLLALVGLLVVRGPVRRGVLVRGVATAAVLAGLAAPAAWAASTTERAWTGSSIGPVAGPAQGMGGPGGPVRGPALPGGPRDRSPGGMPPQGEPGGIPPQGPGGQPAYGPPGGGPGGLDLSGTSTLLTWIRQDGAGSRLDAVTLDHGTGGSLIVAGGRVIAVGGFTGSMTNLPLARLQALVSSGAVRHVVVGTGRGGGPGTAPGATGRAAGADLRAWVTSTCEQVSDAPVTGVYRCSG